MRIRELDQWPPERAGAAAKGDAFCAGTNEMILTRVDGVQEKCVIFTCTFAAKQHTYDFSAEDPSLAMRLENILRKNIGQTLEQIGDLEIEA